MSLTSAEVASEIKRLRDESRLLKSELYDALQRRRFLWWRVTPEVARLKAELYDRIQAVEHLLPIHDRLRNDEGREPGSRQQ